jgi:crossover junction endodeoxyribonuclease RusA
MDVTDGAVQNCVLAGKCLGSKHCRAIVTDASKHIKTWKRAVAEAGRLAAPKTLLDLPLKVFCCFIMPRPKKHYRTGKFSNELRADAPHGHSIAPDALKLMRGTEDALTGIIWKDDCLICDERQTKVYGDKPGAKITISWRDE